MHTGAALNDQISAPSPVSTRTSTMLVSEGDEHFRNFAASLVENLWVVYLFPQHRLEHTGSVPHARVFHRDGVGCGARGRGRQRQAGGVADWQSGAQLVTTFELIAID